LKKKKNIVEVMDLRTNEWDKKKTSINMFFI